MELQEQELDYNSLESSCSPPPLTSRSFNVMCLKVSHSSKSRFVFFNSHVSHFVILLIIKALCNVHVCVINHKYSFGGVSFLVGVVVFMRYHT